MGKKFLTPVYFGCKKQMLGKFSEPLSNLSYFDSTGQEAAEAADFLLNIGECELVVYAQLCSSHLLMHLAAVVSGMSDPLSVAKPSSCAALVV